ncbi:MAG: hypothetical protein ACI39C_07345 [Dietzia sp.]
MTGMEHAIQQAARAEADRKSRDEHWCGDPAVFVAGAEWAVAYLWPRTFIAPPQPRDGAEPAEAWVAGYKAGARDMSGLLAKELRFQDLTTNPYCEGAGQ